MIDEKKLIEELFYKMPYQFGAQEMEWFRDLVETQPKIGEWIPCSKKLPEDREKVLVSRNGEVLENVFEFSIPEKEDYEGECGDTVIGYFLSEYDAVVGVYSDDTIVTAWQPLPEPYHEQVD